MKLRPKNWRDFQHYKNRNPPWIRLHRSLLDNLEYHRLPVASKALAPLLWLLASESLEGLIDASTENLAFRLRMTEKEINAAIRPLIDKGFFMVEQDASKPLAECLRDADSETETETETETEGSQSSPASTDPIEEVFAHWQSVHDHPKAQLEDKRRKLIRSALKHYDPNDLKTAISGYKFSAYHQGKNETRTKYDSIELILRDAEHIDRGIAFAKQKPGEDGQWM